MSIKIEHIEEIRDGKKAADTYCIRFYDKFTAEWERDIALFKDDFLELKAKLKDYEI